MLPQVAEAVAGRGVVPAAPPAALEAAASAPGCWLFRVRARAGVTLRETPSDSAAARGVRPLGSYLRGVQLKEPGRRWLMLDAAEDTERAASYDHMYRRGGGYEDAAYGRAQLWVRLSRAPDADSDGDDGGGGGDPGDDLVLVEEVAPEDSAVLQEVGRGEDDVVDGSDETLPAFDRPFVPRVEDAASGTGDDGAGADDAGRAADDAVAASGAGPASGGGGPEAPALPVGTRVVVMGLAGRASGAYNGCGGTVVAAAEGASGRIGVRLDAPHSGRRIAVKPHNVLARLRAAGRAALRAGGDAEELDDDATAFAAAAAPALAASPIQLDATVMARHARTLGISAGELIGTPSSAGSSPVPYGFGLSGGTPGSRLEAALRAALRDSLQARAGARDCAFPQ